MCLLFDVTMMAMANLAMANSAMPFKYIYLPIAVNSKRQKLISKKKHSIHHTEYIVLCGSCEHFF